MIRALLRKYKSQLGDSVWSICGLVLMNAVAQIVMFPLLRDTYGAQGYGDIQYLMAYVNMVTMTVGTAAGLARMLLPAEERNQNSGDYNIFLLIVSLLGIPFILLIRTLGGVVLDDATTVCYHLLFVAMAFRYYADFSYKITLRYRRYFLYYLLIGAGYGIGVFLAMQTGIWPLALLTGEAMGVLFAYVAESNLRRRGLRPSAHFGAAMRSVGLFCFSEGVGNMIQNADRIIVKMAVGADAVTVYYLATLVGKTMSLITIPLNGVAIGYLMRYDGRLTRRVMHWIALGSLVAVGLFTAICVLGGYIVLLWLYPEDLQSVQPFLWIGSLAQVFYFTTGFITVVLVRFAKKSYQIIINGAFGICFFGIGIPATLMGGLWGFAAAVVIANVIRWLIAILLGYYHTFRDRKGSDGEGSHQNEVT